MSLLETALSSATAAAVHAVADQDPTPDGMTSAPQPGTTPAASPSVPKGLPGRFEIHSTSGTVTEAGATLGLSGFASGAFGATQLLLSTTADARRQMLRLLFERGGQREVLPEVSVHALQRLFSRPLASPIVVAKNERLDIPVHATAPEGVGRLRLAVQGLSQDQMRALRDAGRLRTAGRGVLEPVILGAHTVVPAGAVSHAITFEGRGVDLALYRVAASTDSEANDHELGITLSGPAGNDFAGLSPAQLHTLFERSGMSPRIELPSAFRFGFYVDNPTDVSVPLSIVLEAYPVSS